MDNTVNMQLSALVYSDFAFKILSVIRQMWDSENDRGWSEFTTKPRYSSMLLMVISDIHIRYTAENCSLDCSYGDIVYCPYGSRYNFEVLPPYNPELIGKIKTICINFNMLRPDGKIITLSDHPVKMVSGHNIQLEHDFRDIACSVDSFSPFIRQYKMYKIMKTIIKLQPSNDKKNISLKNALDFLDSHYSEDFKISDLANLCNLSESHFRKLFKEYTDLSPAEYKNQLRIEHAKELLSDGNLTLSEVASAVGIDDQFYFSRLFKSIEGISPTQFKRRSI